MSTYRELYTEGRNKLLAAGIANAEGDARSLLLYASGLSLNQLLLSYENEASEATGDWHQSITERYLDMIDRRCAHVPLQYITHVQNFCGYDMYVDEHVLIPRQDTEILVEKVLDTCGRHYAGDPAPRKSLLDLCTGSGCIAIALSLLGDFGEVCASDVSEGALEVASRNAETNGAHVKFLKSDIFQGVAGDIKFDVIVSNPPYIPDAQVDELDEEVRNHEPRLALAGDADGLYFYRKIAREAGGYLKDGGRLFLEIGCDQGEAVSELLRAAGTAPCECGLSAVEEVQSDMIEAQRCTAKMPQAESEEMTAFTDDGRSIKTGNIKTYKGHYENIEITKDLAGLDRVVSAIWRRTDA